MAIPDANTAAIVCREITEGAPILYAEKGAPEDEADSGWQFLCGSPAEDWRSAKVWALHEVAAYEPALTRFLTSPVGTTLSRSSKEADWIVGSKRQPAK